MKFALKSFVLGGLLVLASFFSHPVLAGRGCCSWHGGQAYCDTSVGRWVCNDGTYSPSCTCWRATPTPVPTPPPNPIDKGNVEVRQSEIKPYFKVKIYWDSPERHYYSIAMSKAAGADPGPNQDTSDNRFEFENVTSGKWYVNMKASVGDVWSQVAYWTVDVPAWVDPTPTPTPTLTPTPTPSPTPTNTPTPTPTPDPKTIEGAKEVLGLSTKKSLLERLFSIFVLIFSKK